MKTESLTQAFFPFCDENRQQETYDLVQSQMELFQIISKIIDNTKKQFETRVKNDPIPELYEDRTYYIHTLTLMIKANVNQAINDGILKLYKARYMQCQYYVVPDLFSIYIKKLSEKGLPSYVDSLASGCRLQNDEDLPCVFIGPRVDSSGVVGGTCLTITNGKDDAYWVLDVIPKQQDSDKSIDFVLEETEVDDICKSKEEFAIRRKKTEQI